jgi:hypothetical protein
MPIIHLLESLAMFARLSPIAVLVIAPPLSAQQFTFRDVTTEAGLLPHGKGQIERKGVKTNQRLIVTS